MGGWVDVCLSVCYCLSVCGWWLDLSEQDCSLYMSELTAFRNTKKPAQVHVSVERRCASHMHYPS